MAYRIRFTKYADADIADYVAFIIEQEKSVAPARKWFRDIKAAVFELAFFPLSRPKIPEEKQGSHEYREAQCHSHRIIFSVDEGSELIIVHRVYHSRRRILKMKDIEGSDSP
jgi:plasmid stabilization system protein ParE